MPNLEEIHQEMENIFDASKELSDEEQQQAALDYLEQLALQEADKVDAIGFVDRKSKSEVAFLKEEETRIRSRRQALEKRLAHFKVYLRDLMLKRGLKKIKGQHTTIFLRDTTSVHLLVPDQDLPEGFRKRRVEYKADKPAIKKALSAGELVPGAELVTSTGINIR